MQIISKPYRWSIIFILLMLILSGCTQDSETEDPDIYTPECAVPELIQAIADANADGVPSEIQLPSNCVYTLDQINNTFTWNGLTVNNGLPRITSEITIRGNSSTIEILPSSSQTFGHFFLSPEADLMLYDLTLSDGIRPVGGSIINNQGDLFVYNVKFFDNRAYPILGTFTAQGGAIFNYSGKLRILANSFFQGNLAGETMVDSPHVGGAVFSINSNVLINNSFFYNNFAAGSGGAVYTVRSPGIAGGNLITIQNSEFSANSSLMDGGALYLKDESEGVFIVSSFFMDNHSGNYGGAVFCEDSDVTADYSQFYGNQSENGGAVYTRRSAAGEISKYISDHSTYSSNIADANGGAIFSENTDLEMEDSTVSFNQAGSCGALHLGGYPGLNVAAGDLETSLWMNSSSELRSNTISSNQAVDGMGGGVCHLMGELSINGSDLENNQATGYGGGLISLSELDISESAFTGNQAMHGGGLVLGFPRDETSSFTPDLAYYAFSSSLFGSVISDNSAEGAGGGLWSNHDGSVFINKSVIGGNDAGEEGGGIYHDQGNLSLRNSTVAENTSWRGGGIYHEGTGSSDPVLSLTHVTVAYNSATDGGSELRSGGGGLNINGIVYIDSSLVAHNTNNDCDLNQGLRGGGDYVFCDDTYCFSRLLNFDTDDSCGFDLQSIPSPQLGSFSGNYVPILAGSPLIDIFGYSFCDAADDQISNLRPEGSNCEPGSIEYISVSPPPPPPPPQAPPADETSDCDPFAGLEVSVRMLNIDPQSLVLPVYLRFPEVVPFINEDGTIPYYGMLGGERSTLCNQQGFDDRLYCMFALQPSMPGTLQVLEFYKEGCPDPVLTEPNLSIPEVPLTCGKNLNEKACKETGGIWFTGVDDPYCLCP